MSDIKKLLESIDSLSSAANKPTGPKFPGYWKGTDSAKKAKSKMVGSAQESVLPEIAQQAKDGTIHRKLAEAWQQYKSMAEQTRSAPTAIPGQRGAVNQDGKIYTPKEVDAITQDPEAFSQSVVQTSSGPLRSGSGEPVLTGTGSSSRLRTSSTRPTVATPATTSTASPVAQPSPRLSTATRETPYHSSDDLAPTPAETRPLRVPTVTSSERVSKTDDKDLPPATPVKSALEPGTPADLVDLLTARQAIEQAKDAKYKPVSIDRNFAISALAQFNNITNPNQIRAGDTIKLIDANGQIYNYRIAPGDNLWNISRGKLRGQRV